MKLSLGRASLIEQRSEENEAIIQNILNNARKSLMLALESAVQISSATKSSWPHLDEKTVMDRLNLLISHPSLINQGANGLCGEATFYHHILDRLLKKGDFLRMAQALFRDGICRLGDLKIDPRPRLLKADYPQIVADRGSTEPPTPPQADWMLLTALRDSNNFWSHDYEGRPNRKAENSTSKERIKWYEKSGLYKQFDFFITANVLSQQDKINFITQINTSIKQPGHHHISMDIIEEMIRTGNSEKHTISLESPLVLDPTNGITFQYWSWGKNHDWDEFLTPKPLFMTIDSFFTNLDSVVIATYE